MNKIQFKTLRSILKKIEVSNKLKNLFLNFAKTHTFIGIPTKILISRSILGYEILIETDEYHTNYCPLDNQCKPILAIFTGVPISYINIPIQYRFYIKYNGEV